LDAGSVLRGFDVAKEEALFYVSNADDTILVSVSLAGANSPPGEGALRAVRVPFDVADDIKLSKSITSPSQV
jgi:hypothetical protein